MNCCIRCKKLLEETSNTKTCETCIYYIGEQMVCERCNFKCTRKLLTKIDKEKQEHTSLYVGHISVGLAFLQSCKNKPIEINLFKKFHVKLKSKFLCEFHSAKPIV